MRDIRAIVNSDAAQTHALFAKHIEKITLTPNGGSLRGFRDVESSRPWQYRLCRGPELDRTYGVHFDWQAAA